jgi:hypothetical protein
MLFRFTAFALILAAPIIPLLADGDSKPACRAETRGMMWPDAANRDPRVLKKTAHCGELEICMRGHWRYRWESLTVRLDKLPGGSGLPKPADCEIQPEPSNEAVPAGSGR